jgi:predicted NodU family carbamoyl transferase
MIVLGLNGSGQRGDHDAAACLLVDGRIVAFTEEERFIRHKHAWHSAPYTATASCLAAAGLSVDDIDVVAYGWDLPRRLMAQGAAPPADDRGILELLLPGALFVRHRDPAVEIVPHHVAHAASAFFLSGAGSGPIMVVDGHGERESISIAVGNGRDIKILEKWPITASLGHFYEAACEYAGLGNIDVGKLMGLAAHGTPAADVLNIADDPDGPYALRNGVGPKDLESAQTIGAPAEIQARWMDYFAQAWHQPRNDWHRRYDPLIGATALQPATDPFEYRDFAATVQDTLEGVVLTIVRDLLRQVDGQVLHVAGGVGFNASLNGVILNKIGERRLFVQPVAGDAGVALGAAAYVAAQAGDEVEPLPGNLGFGWRFNVDEIRRVLDRSGFSYAEPADLASRVAALIAAGKVVGWFQGGSEVGPRALGHRSILATPSSQEIRDHINLRVKQREPWRPFAPSIRGDALSSMIGSRVADLPYMIVTAPVQAAWLGRLEGVAHVDGSTRPQTVTRQTDPLYADLLDAVANATGIPVVLNTSFNGRREPLVETPAQALTTFALNGLDALAMGPFLVTAQRYQPNGWVCG